MFHPQGPTFIELARQCLSSTERGYDLLAEKFDYTPFRTPDAILSVVAERMKADGPVGAALDVCCGTGAAMLAIRPLCRERLVGIDMSRGMLEVAEQNLAAAAKENTSGPAMEFIRGDVLTMAFEPRFDLAVCFGALGHILPRDEPQFVSQIAQALNPGGRFVFVTTEMPPPWSSAYWLSRGFNAAMHVRNLLVRPPFIMFYLTFLLPAVAKLLESHSFSVAVERPFTGPLKRLRLVIATRS